MGRRYIRVNTLCVRSVPACTRPFPINCGSEQRHPSIARKRQFVQVTRFMKVSNQLSMSGHALIPVDESRDLPDSQKQKCNQQTFYANR